MKRRLAPLVQKPAPLTQAPAPHMMFRPSPGALSETSRSTYRDEKAKAVRERALPHAEIMADAKRAFEQMIADGKAARHRGRPRKIPLPLLVGTPDVRPGVPAVERASGTPATERSSGPAAKRAGKGAARGAKVARVAKPARAAGAPARKKSGKASARPSSARAKKAPSRAKPTRAAKPQPRRAAKPASRRGK